MSGTTGPTDGTGVAITCYRGSISVPSQRLRVDAEELGRYEGCYLAVDLIRRDLERARAGWLAEVAPAPGESSEEHDRRVASDFLLYRDSQGRVADFHSLRHTFVTNLVRAGVQPKDAKELARHSSITLTMDRYAHVTLQDTAAALAKLPGCKAMG